MSVSKQVKPWDHEWIPLGASVMILGKRFSGKSLLQQEIMEAMSPKFDMAFAMSPTEPARERFRKCMPKWCVMDISVELLEKLTMFMKTRYARRRLDNKRPENWLLVLDDTAFDNKFMRSRALNEIFMNGRNFGCTIIIVCQYLKTAPPVLRTNTDIVFAFWEESEVNRKNLHESFFSCIPRKDFDGIFQSCTENYSALVHDMRKTNCREWQDKIFWKRAKIDIPSFRIGYPSMFHIDDGCFVLDPSVDPRGASAASRFNVLLLEPSKDKDKDKGKGKGASDDDDVDDEADEAAETTSGALAPPIGDGVDLDDSDFDF